MIATAWARLSEELRGSVGMVTSTWPRSISALVRPRSSRPNTIATGPSADRSSSSAAPSRGRTVRRFAVRPRAVRTATCTQSASAASSESTISIRATKSALLCAMPSMRQGSKLSGFTSRMSLDAEVPRDADRAGDVDDVLRVDEDQNRGGRSGGRAVRRSGGRLRSGRSPRGTCRSLRLTRLVRLTA